MLIGLIKNTMKKKVLLVLITLLSGAVIASAQISTGEPSASVYKAGNRPQAGDFGLFVGGGVIFDFDFNSLDMGGVLPDIRPLINVKYFLTDEVESRLGIHVGRSRQTVKSTLDVDDAPNTTAKEVSGGLNLYPGLAYHFNKNNLLDVYVGAELPVGFRTEKSNNAAGNAYLKSTVTNPYIGLGAFIGLQAFIGNLPLGIALEYGISGKLLGNNLPKYSESDGSATQTYYLSGGDTPTKYKAYSGSNAIIGSEIRLSLSYYFK